MSIDMVIPLNKRILDHIVSLMANMPQREKLEDVLSFAAVCERLARAAAARTKAHRAAYRARMTDSGDWRDRQCSMLLADAEFAAALAGWFEARGNVEVDA